jgi:hypothetical protein
MDMSLKERNLMQVAIDHFIEYQQDVFDLECNNHISLGYRAASDRTIIFILSAIAPLD